MTMMIAAGDELPSRALRLLAWHDPATAVDLLQQAANARRGAGHGIRADRWLLLAETSQRLGRWQHALRAAQCANIVLALADTADLSRAARVAAVTADIAVGTGHDDAVQTCTQYQQSLAGSTNYLAVAVAAALHAVAVYLRDGVQAGLDALHAIRHQVDDSLPLAWSLDAGITAVRAACTRPVAPAAGLLPPLPGMLLAPFLAEPARDWLAHRISLHRPRLHTCDHTAVEATAPNSAHQETPR